MCWFTLIGFLGMYVVLSILFLFLVYREIDAGPSRATPWSHRRSNGRNLCRTGRSDMPTLWYCLVAFMIAVYVLLDGFDLGVGIVHLGVARTDAERRTVIGSIGPVWDGNEVWLLAGGGTLFFAFPVLYASSFSGFYLPLMMVLWLLILRGISIEFRSLVPGPLWSPFWDLFFCVSSALLAIFFGAALGNVVRGVPLDAREISSSHFGLISRFGAAAGVLDWYTILVGDGVIWFWPCTARCGLYTNAKVKSPPGPVKSRDGLRGASASNGAGDNCALRVQPQILSESHRTSVGLYFSRRWRLQVFPEFSIFSRGLSSGA